MPAPDRIARSVTAALFFRVARGAQACPACHIGNLGQALIPAAERGKVGAADVVSDWATATLEVVVTLLLVTRNMTPKDRNVPLGLARRRAGILAEARRAFRLKGEPPVTRRALRRIAEGFAIATSRGRDERGPVPIVSWEDGRHRFAQPMLPVSAGMMPEDRDARAGA